jgi:tetratricopeptide (TPR) repeat protein
LENLNRSISLLANESADKRFGLASLPSVNSRVYRAHALAELGRFKEASADVEAAIKIAESYELLTSLCLAYLGYGYVCMMMGDSTTAITKLENSLQIIKNTGLPFIFSHLAPTLGYAYMLSGRLSEAVSLLEHVLEVDIAKNFMIKRASTLVRLGEAYLLCKRNSDAMACAEQAVEIAQNSKEPGNEAHALRLFGEILSQRLPIDLETAEKKYIRAVTIARKLEMRPLEAHCYFGLGKLFQRVTQIKTGKEYFLKAKTIYCELNMDHWQNKVEVSIKEIDK